MLTAADRRQIYCQWIQEGLACFSKTHSDSTYTKTGCFFPPYNKKLSKYSNARWQEIVLPLAWNITRQKDSMGLSLINKGIMFWSTLQNRSGSFPQYCRRDNDFSATAFSSYAVSATLNKVGADQIFPDEVQSSVIRNCLHKSGNWLSRNNELVYCNQQMAAALALLELSHCLDSSMHRESAAKKLEQVLRKKETGVFPEKRGADIGYSTLTLELLARFFLRSHDSSQKDRILEAVESYLNSLIGNPSIWCFGSGTRNTDWVIPGGFEVFAPSISKAKKYLEEVFQTQDIRHLPDTRHVHTDLCRLCMAYDQASVPILGSLSKNEKVEYEIQQDVYPTNFRLLRPIGLHRFRGWL